MRHLRHRPPRVRRGPDRHPHEPTPPDRGDPAPDPRARVLRPGRRGGLAGHGRRRGRPGQHHARHRLRPMHLLPPGTGAPVRSLRVHRAVRRDRGLAQYAVLKEYQVSTLPDEVSDVEGAVVEPASVAAYGIDRVGIRGGDIVLVTGAGPIGVLSALYADALGASTVVIAEPNPNRAALAAASTSARCSTRPPTGSRMSSPQLTRGAGVDVVAECSGTTPGLTTAMNSVRTRGLDRPDRTAHQARHASTRCACPRRTSAISAAGATSSPTGRGSSGSSPPGKYPVAKAVTAQIDLEEVVPRASTSWSTRRVTS